MRSVLLDTNVLSELIRQRPEPRVVDFVRSQPSALISVLTLHELTYVAARVEHAARRAALEGWLAGIRGQFDGSWPVTVGPAAPAASADCTAALTARQRRPHSSADRTAAPAALR